MKVRLNQRGSVVGNFGSIHFALFCLIEAKYKYTTIKKYNFKISITLIFLYIY